MIHMRGLICSKAQMFQAVSDKILHKNFTNRHFFLFFENFFLYLIVNKYFIAFSYPIITVPHLNILTQSVPVSRLPSLVSGSVPSAQESRSKWPIKKTPTFAQYLTSHIVESSQWKFCSARSIGVIWLPWHPLYQDITSYRCWFWWSVYQMPIFN